MSTNNQDKKTTPKTEGFKIRVSEPIEFGGILKNQYLTTAGLASLINGLFRPVFSDYEGCFINIDVNTGAMNCTIYFKDKGDPETGKIKNIEPITGKTSSNELMARIQNMRAANSSRRFQLTADTRSALEDFIPHDPNKKIDWKNYVFETTETQNFFNAQYNIYLRVVGLDLNRLIKMIYGGKIVDESGEPHYIDYMVNVVKPLNNVMQMSSYANLYQNSTMQPGNTNYLLNISQLDKKYLDELCSELGFGMVASGTIPMYR